MANIEIWYDKAAEVDPVHSWAAACQGLQNRPRQPLDYAPYPAVLALMEYARPDVVLTADGEPFLVMELTQMNPSGHNLPQRFSCLVRAAELQIPAVYYYLEFARRSASDPNPRYVNIRVPLGQLRLSEIYSTPSVSILWPTDPQTLQAMAGVHVHTQLINFVDHAIQVAQQGGTLGNQDAQVATQFTAMKHLVDRYYGNIYQGSPMSSYNLNVPTGSCSSDRLVTRRISPPESCQLISTRLLLANEYDRLTGSSRIKSNKKTAQLLTRDFTLHYKGTANAKKDGPEHPYPGYLTLIDILYARSLKGMVRHDRTHNLAFSLPIDLNVFKDKALDRQTGLNILMEFADLVILNDAVVVGGYLRNLSAGAILI